MRKIWAVVLCVFFCFACAYNPYPRNLETMKRALVEVETKSYVKVENEDGIQLTRGIGFIVNQRDNIVMTNCHVVEDFFNELRTDISVRLSDKEICGIKNIDCNGEDDIAFIKLDCSCENMPFFTISESPLRIKDKIVFVGIKEVSSGVVEKAFLTGKIYFSISTPFKLGDSGTPIVNEEGRAVAIATAILINPDTKEILGFGAVRLKK